MSDDSDNTNDEGRERWEERIMTLLRAEPFQPFEIILTSGDRYLITGPFSLAIGRTSMSSLYPPKGGSMLFRKSQIVGVEVPEPAA